MAVQEGVTQRLLPSFGARSHSVLQGGCCSGWASQQTASALEQRCAVCQRPAGKFASLAGQCAFSLQARQYSQDHIVGVCSGHAQATAAGQLNISPTKGMPRRPVLRML